LKVALVEFEGTDTLAGIVMLPVEVNATVAAAVGGLLNVTVQTATAPGASDDGVQESPLTNGVLIVVAVPPVPVIVNASPLSVAPNVPETPTPTEVAIAANVMDAVATMPLAMTLVLIPVATQI
jgi:hypothetical protein